jgi:two-component system, chemotaxis family, protein-glutamate methylesterase/glutaminase
LPPNLPAVVAIVLHRSPHYDTQLPSVLGRHALLSVLEPTDRDPVLPGAVYVAPRDQHMIFDNGYVSLSRGPREHHTRPAIAIRFSGRPPSDTGRAWSVSCSRAWDRMACRA